MPDPIATEAETLATAGITAADKAADAVIAAKFGPSAPLFTAAVDLLAGELKSIAPQLIGEGVAEVEDWGRRLKFFVLSEGLIHLNDKLHFLSNAELLVAFDVGNDPHASDATSPRPHGWMAHDLTRPEVKARVLKLCELRGLVKADQG